MSGSSKTVGVILILAAIAIALGLSLWLLSGVAEESLRRSGFFLGLVLVALVDLPLLGGGGSLLRQPAYLHHLLRDTDHRHLPAGHSQGNAGVNRRWAQVPGLPAQRRGRPAAGAGPHLPDRR